MRDRNHDGELGAGGEDTSAETNENLGERNDAGVGVGSSEGDQKSCAENDDWHTSVGSPLEVTSVADGPRDERAEGR